MVASLLATAVVANEHALDGTAVLAGCEQADWRCYHTALRRGAPADAVLDRLEARRDRSPADAGALLALGLVHRDLLSHDRSLRLLGRAAEALAERSDPAGEVTARVALAEVLSIRGLFDRAAAELERADAVAADRMLAARVRCGEAELAAARFDYGRAWPLFQQAEAAAGGGGPAELRARIEVGLAQILYATNRYEESLERYARAARLLHEAGDPFGEADALVGVARLTGMLHDRHTLEEMRRGLQDALELAQNTGNPTAEAAARGMIAYDFGRPPAERLRHAERSLAIYREAGDISRTAEAMLDVVSLRRIVEPGNDAELEQTHDAAIGLARSVGDLWQELRGLRRRADDRYRIGDAEGWLADAVLMLDVSEKIRDLQRDDLARAWVASENSRAYYQLSGRLLREPERFGRARSLDLAFEVMERLRARVLLERLDAAGATVAAQHGREEHAERDAVLDRIAALQRRLLAPALPPGERAEALSALRRLEAEELEIRERLARSDARFARLRAPRLPALEEVRDALAPDQPLLLFQLSLSPKPGSAWNVDVGGSWCLVLTPEESRVVAVPDDAVVADAVAMFLGVVERRDGSEAPAAAALYRQLLADSLDAIPDRVSRLVIVPDKDLHGLPFGALRERSDSEPLATRYQIAYAPSAALWFRWRTEQHTSGPIPALALADPDLPFAAEAAEWRDAAPWIEGLRLGRLPYARREGRSLVRRLGGGSVLRTGAAASERFIKAADFERYSVLHFAAHAVADEQHPERSAILLTPGAAEEDGLLQMREVVELRLDGRAVVLSACRTGAGAVLPGEGAMGLARAFFQAGARTVVASLWPLRDAEAARLVDGFYERLAAGESVAAALAGSRRQMIASGAPAAAWAGLVVLGDGDLIPLPDGVPARAGGLRARALALAALAGLLVVLLISRRR